MLVNSTGSVISMNSLLSGREHRCSQVESTLMIYYMSARERESVSGCSYYTHTLLIRREVTQAHIDTLSPLTQCDYTDGEIQT